MATVKEGEESAVSASSITTSKIFKKPKDLHHYKLYINSEDQEFWNYIEQFELDGLSPSKTICQLLKDRFRTNGDPTNDLKIRQREKEQMEQFILQRQTDILNTMDPFSLLKKAAEVYNNNRSENSSLEYVIPKKYTNQEVSKEEMVNIITFLMEAYNIVIRTDVIKNFIRDNHQKFLTSIRDFSNEKRVEAFKNQLRKEFSVDVELLESEQKEREQKEREKIRWESHNEERRQWEIDNPDKKWCYRNMTDEEIAISERIGKGELLYKNGEYILIEPVDDSQDDIDLYDDNTIETDIRGP